MSDITDSNKYCRHGRFFICFFCWGVNDMWGIPDWIQCTHTYCTYKFFARKDYDSDISVSSDFPKIFPLYQPIRSFTFPIFFNFTHFSCIFLYATVMVLIFSRFKTFKAWVHGTDQSDAPQFLFYFIFPTLETFVHIQAFPMLHISWFFFLSNVCAFFFCIRR